MSAETEMPAPATTTIFFLVLKAATSLSRSASSALRKSQSGLVRSRYSVVRTLGAVGAILRLLAGEGELSEQVTSDGAGDLPRPPWDEARLLAGVCVPEAAVDMGEGYR